MAAGTDNVIFRGETTIPQIKEEIFNTLNKPGIKLIDSIVILPDTINNKQYFGLVTLSVINLRKEPEHSAELVSQAILGTPVLILKQENSWLLIQTPDRYISWTEKSSVRMISRAELYSWQNAPKIIYLENSGWVYNESDEAVVTGDLVSGSILEKTGESGKYVTVKFPDGREGLIRKAELADYKVWEAECKLSGDNLVNTARTFLGLPYLWGGSSSKAVDCSGFVQSVFFRNGVILSRDASLQAAHGEDVEISKDYSGLVSGDLLFFGSENEKGTRVTHVAMYLGANEFIHASSRVMINSLDSSKANFSSYRKNTLLSARRIAGVLNDPGIVPVSEHLWY